MDYEFDCCVQPKLFDDNVGFKPFTFQPSEMEQAAKNLKGRPACLQHNAPVAGDSDEVLNEKILGRVINTWVSYEKYNPITEMIDIVADPQRIMARIRIASDGIWGPHVIQGIEQGKLKGVSLGIMHTKITDEGGEVVDIEKMPMEVSICKEGDIPFSNIYNPTFVSPENPMTTYETQDIQMFDNPTSFSNPQVVYTQASNGKKIRNEFFLTVSSADWKDLVKEPISSGKKKMTTPANPANPTAQPPAPAEPQPSAMELRVAALEKKLADETAEKQKAQDELSATKIFDEHKATFESASKAIGASMARWDAKSPQYASLQKRKTYWDDMHKNKLELLQEENRKQILDEAEYAISTAPPEVVAPADPVGAAASKAVVSKASGAAGNTGQMSTLEKNSIEEQKKRKAGELAAATEQDNALPAWKRRMYGNTANAASKTVNDLVSPVKQPAEEMEVAEGEEPAEAQPQFPMQVDGSPWNMFTRMAAETCGVMADATPASYQQDIITLSSKEELDAYNRLPRQDLVQFGADRSYERRSGPSSATTRQKGNNFFTLASKSDDGSSNFVGGKVSKKEIELHQIKSPDLRAHNLAHTYETWASMNEASIKSAADIFA